MRIPAREAAAVSPSAHGAGPATLPPRPPLTLAASSCPSRTEPAVLSRAEPSRAEPSTSCPPWAVPFSLPRLLHGGFPPSERPVPGALCKERGSGTRPSPLTPFQSLAAAAGWGIPAPANSSSPEIHLPCGEDAGPRQAGRPSPLLGSTGEPGLGRLCPSTETAASSWPCEALEIGPAAPGEGRDCTRCAPGSRRIVPGNRESYVSKYIRCIFA